MGHQLNKLASRIASVLCLASTMGTLALAKAQQPSPLFVDVTKQVGISFKHSIGDTKLDNIVEGTGAGVCVFDFNNDGWMDIYFVTGTWTPAVSDNRGRHLRGKLNNRLYQNMGDGTFKDVTEQAGVGGKGFYATGCSAADFDNDGFEDLYVLNYGRNILYRNNGDGTFTDVARQAGLDDARWSVSAVWLDYDRDGHLDVYVANYLKYDDGQFRQFYPAQGYPGPLSYQGAADALYRNNGDGTFTDVTRSSGVFRDQYRAMSVSAADINNDGWLDIYVANDAMENSYFENTGKGTFVEKGLQLNIAFSEHGQGVSSMGPAIGDINRDGLLDIFIPDLRYNTLLIQGPKIFEDRTRASGLSQALGQYSGWAAILFDYNHDGWLDLFTVHGHAHFEYVQEDTLLRNNQDGTFTDVSSQSGQYFHEKYVGRGAAAVDYDNDGDLDLVVVNLNDRAVLLRNEGGNNQRWLTVAPRLALAKGQSRWALGTRVTLEYQNQKQFADMVPVRGYLSQQDPRLHFGLGDAKVVDRLIIRWPDGTEKILQQVPSNQILTVVQPVKSTKPTQASSSGVNGGRAQLQPTGAKP